MILWFYVNAEGMIEMNYVVPLEYDHLPSSNLSGAHQTFSQEVSLKLMGKEIRVVDRRAVMIHVILGREKYN